MTLKYFRLLAIFVLVPSLIEANRLCYKCSGINCLRTSVNYTEVCQDSLDVCVTIFRSSEVLVRGCLLEIPMDLRSNCQKQNSANCHLCHGNLCNNLARKDMQCIKCDSNENSSCRTNPRNLTPERCSIPKSLNSYCYVQYDGQRTIRGCSLTLEDQMNCFQSDNCMLCFPGEIENCNQIDFISTDSPITTPTAKPPTTQQPGSSTEKPESTSENPESSSKQPATTETPNPGSASKNSLGTFIPFSILLFFVFKF